MAPYLSTPPRRDSHSHRWDRSSYDNISARSEPQPLTEISLREMVEESVGEALRGIRTEVVKKAGRNEKEASKANLPYGNLNKRKLRIRR